VCLTALVLGLPLPLFCPSARGLGLSNESSDNSLGSPPDAATAAWRLSNYNTHTQTDRQNKDVSDLTHSLLQPRWMCGLYVWVVSPSARSAVLSSDVPHSSSTASWRAGGAAHSYIHTHTHTHTHTRIEKHRASATPSLPFSLACSPLTVRPLRVLRGLLLLLLALLAGDLGDRGEDCGLSRCVCGPLPCAAPPVKAASPESPPPNI
jgi:hypothetical protein